MSLILILSCVLVIFYQTTGLSEHNVHPTKGQKKEEEDASASNSSYYSTKEMRDMCLKEWAGRTQEVQEYFDQLPSEEFKENSDTLKLMHYYEKKGIKDIDSKQIYNVTTQVREPIGSEHTIEVNDSYVPKYRITPSEEINMEKYGTFNSKPEEYSSEESGEVTTEAVVTTEPPGSEGDIPGGKKKRKKWPPHMDPKGKIRRRKKKKAFKADQVKRKEMIENEINIPKRNNLKMKKVGMQSQYLNRLRNNYQLGILGINQKTNKIKYEDAYRKNMEDVLNRREHSNMNKINEYGGFKGSAVLKQNINRKKHISIFDSFMSSCKLNHKQKDFSHRHHRNLSRSRQRSWSYNQHLQPFI